MGRYKDALTLGADARGLSMGIVLTVNRNLGHNLAGLGQRPIVRAA